MSPPGKKTRILLVAKVDSIHTVRWLRQFSQRKDLEFWVFPSSPARYHPKMPGRPRMSLLPALRRETFSLCTLLPNLKLTFLVHNGLAKLGFDQIGRWWLRRTIQILKPDIVHSLEFQGAGYLCHEVKKELKTCFPTWIATNWGSDLFLFSRLKDHREKVISVLQEAQYYSAECQRDYDLARDLGMSAEPLPLVPNTGGFDLRRIKEMRERIPVADRKIILVKGYQSIFGRALVALELLTKNSVLLKGFEVHIYSAAPAVVVAAELAQQDFGIPIKTYPEGSLSHEDVLELQAKARVYLGLSISDGISTSLLESMALGSFPIQSCTACANEWIQDGVTGFTVNPTQNDHLEKSLRRALQDDQLVISAAEGNWATVQARLDHHTVAATASQFYDFKTAVK